MDNKCPFCDTEIVMQRIPDPAGRGVWTLKCDCTQAEHPWMQKAIEIYESKIATHPGVVKTPATEKE